MTEATDVLRGGAADLGSILTGLRAARTGLVPFDERVTAFTADLSRRLRRRRDIQSSPAFAALAYWIRPATIERLHQEWEALQALSPAVVRVPRGLVFHLPPANVDTTFVYSWLLSALCGNANVIRLSSRSLDASHLLVDIVGEVLGDHDEIAATTSIVSYGHEREITQELSTADMRVIWGGDEAVAAVRSVPSAPYTRDLAFPDRFSMTALGTEAVVTANDDAVDALAKSLYNDAFWFDQLGCASPRTIVWVGRPHDVERASGRLRAALRSHLAERGQIEPPTSAVLSKFVHIADAAARGVIGTVDRSCNLLTSAMSDRLVGFERDAPGGGLFYEMRAHSLVDLAPLITRRDQTLGVYGIDATSISDFVRAVGSRGIDRIVPVGTALEFGRFWDGVDLLVEFSRVISLPDPRGSEPLTR